MAGKTKQETCDRQGTSSKLIKTNHKYKPCPFRELRVYQWVSSRIKALLSKALGQT
jgi:hypothetical protein